MGHEVIEIGLTIKIGAAPAARGSQKTAQLERANGRRGLIAKVFRRLGGGEVRRRHLRLIARFQIRGFIDPFEVN